jgi:hypothetical protein
VQVFNSSHPYVHSRAHSAAAGRDEQSATVRLRSTARRRACACPRAAPGMNTMYRMRCSGASGAKQACASQHRAAEQAKRRKDGRPTDRDGESAAGRQPHAQTVRFANRMLGISPVELYASHCIEGVSYGMGLLRRSRVTVRSRSRSCRGGRRAADAQAHRRARRREQIMCAR